MPPTITILISNGGVQPHSNGVGLAWLSIADQVIVDNVRLLFYIASDGDFVLVRAMACGNHSAVASRNKDGVRSIVVVVVVEFLVAAEVRDGEEIRQRGWFLRDSASPIPDSVALAVVVVGGAGSEELGRALTANYIRHVVVGLHPRCKTRHGHQHHANQHQKLNRPHAKLQIRRMT